MSLERIAAFPEYAPSKDQLERAIRDYFGAVATQVEWKRDRFYVSLAGRPTSIGHRFYPTDTRNLADERWFKVWLDGRILYVAAQGQDELTNALANSFIEACARLWDGFLK